MRKLHWTTVPVATAASSMWKDMDETAITLDTEEVEALFGQKATGGSGVRGSSAHDTASGEGGGSSREERSKKQEKVQLVDGKRAYAVAIGLARFRMENSHLRDAVLFLDPEVLTSERVAQLLKVAPTTAELEAVLAYTGDPSLLGTTETFFLCVSSIPRLQQRLSLFAFKLNFTSCTAAIRSNLKTVSQAIASIRDSTQLTKLLTMVLAVGNYLNGGTKKGQAYGFKLSTLARLKQSKTVDNKSTLLHYLLSQLRKQDSSNLQFIEDLSVLQEATRCESQFLEAEVSKVSTTLKAIGAEINLATETDQDRFKPVMTSFFITATEESEMLVNCLEALKTDFDALLKKFGEVGYKWEEFFELFAAFRSDCCKVIHQLDEVDRKEQAAKKRAEAQKARKGEAGKVKKKASSAGKAKVSVATTFNKMMRRESVAAANTEAYEQMMQAKAGDSKDGKAKGDKGKDKDKKKKKKKDEGEKKEKKKKKDKDKGGDQKDNNPSKLQKFMEKKRETAAAAAAKKE